MNGIKTLSHTARNRKYHIVFAPKYRHKVFYGEKRYVQRAVDVRPVRPRLRVASNKMQYAV